MKKSLLTTLVIGILAFLTYWGIEMYQFAAGVQKDALRHEKLKLEQKNKLDHWTDSIKTTFFDKQFEFDSIQRSPGERYREYSYAKNEEQYLLIDNLDTLVKVITIKKS